MKKSHTTQFGVSLQPGQYIPISFAVSGRPPMTSSTTLRSLRQIPGPPCYPLVGSLLQYSRWGPFQREKYHMALTAMFRQYGPVVKEKIGWDKTIVHVFEPGGHKNGKVVAMEKKKHFEF